MTAFIYLSTNTVNGNRYVGKTKNSIKSRLKGHFYDARHESQTVFAKAIRKYGESAFTIEVLEETSEDLLNEREIFFIAKLKPEYNMTKGGEGGVTISNVVWVNNGIISLRIPKDSQPQEGFVLGILESTRAKMRGKRKSFSKASCDNMREARLKFRHTQESKDRMSAARKEVWRLKKEKCSPIEEPVQSITYVQLFSGDGFFDYDDCS